MGVGGEDRAAAQLTAATALGSDAPGAPLSRKESQGQTSLGELGSQKTKK